MSDLVFVQGPNGLVIGYTKAVASGLLRHPDHKKVGDPWVAGPPVVPAADPAPPGNASKDDWYAYALAHGKTSADLTDLGQREIRALFTE